MLDARAKWTKRVSDWRTSGETAQAFAARRGFTARSLRRWSSRLKRDVASAPPAVVRLAQLVRSRTSESAPRHSSILIELLDMHVRITVEPGADREALALTVALLVGSTR
jgi:hypothetical protein